MIENQYATSEHIKCGHYVYCYSCPRFPSWYSIYSCCYMADIKLPIKPDAYR